MQAGSTHRPGWQTALDVAVAPVAAFTRLRETPTWGWAFVIAALLGMAGSFALGPLVGHLLAIELPAKLAASAQFARLPADARADLIVKQITIAQTIARFSFVAVPFGLALSCMLQTLVMLAANAIGKGQATFAKLWAVAVNAAVIGTGLASLALTFIALVRGPDGFGSTADLARALPGFGLLAPAAGGPTSAFLGAINVFGIWSSVLLAVGLTIVARLGRAVAIATALAIVLGAALFAAAGAALQG